MASDALPSTSSHIRRKPQETTGASRSPLEEWKAKKALILQAMHQEPNLSVRELAERFNAHQSTIYKLKEKLKEGNSEEDRGQLWGRLLSKAVPLALRANVMRDLVKSSNPVAASRALEMVLESDGLRKKVAEPSRQASIVVKASDDVGFE